VNCGINVPPLEPRSFSFNSAYGACKRCHGFGQCPRSRRGQSPAGRKNSSREVWASWRPADRQGSAYLRSALLALVKHFKADVKTLFVDLPKEVRDAFFHGINAPVEFHSGTLFVCQPLERRAALARERLMKPFRKSAVALEELVSPTACPIAKDKGCALTSAGVRLGGRGIAEYAALPIEEAVRAFAEIKLTKRGRADRWTSLWREIRNRLQFFANMAWVTDTRSHLCDAFGRRGSNAFVWRRRSARNYAECSTSLTSLP